MKKIHLTSIFLLGTLLLFASINNSVAATPSYIGINEGDEYTWSISWDSDTLQEFLTDIGQEPEEADQFIETESISVKLTINRISEEKTAEGLTYVEVKATPTIGFAELEDSMYVWILKNDTAEYMASLGALMSGAEEGIIPGLFVPTDLDWNAAASEFQGYIDLRATDVDMTMTAYSNGLKLIIPAFTFEEEGKEISLKAVEGEIKYNVDGVLESAQAKYDGKVMATIQLGGVIPGYEIPVLLGFSACGIISLVVLIRKKKQIM
ncbi:MAG: Loki-CTERM sorting domain-containing protein [Promethearchaeota archaeon]